MPIAVPCYLTQTPSVRCCPSFLTASPHGPSLVSSIGCLSRSSALCVLVSRDKLDGFRAGQGAAEPTAARSRCDHRAGSAAQKKLPGEHSRHSSQLLLVKTSIKERMPCAYDNLRALLCSTHKKRCLATLDGVFPLKPDIHGECCPGQFLVFAVRQDQLKNA